MRDRFRFFARCLCQLVLAFVLPAAALAQPVNPIEPAGSDETLIRLTLPKVGLRARDLAVVVNDDDPASVEIGRYYAMKRHIEVGNVIHVRFPAGQAVMAFADFERVKAVLDAKVEPSVQAFALAWTLPFRVECMSVTAAFALGFDPGAYCAEGCRTTKASPYFDSRSSAPFSDHRVRPAMLLAGADVESVKRLIDRGVRSDDNWPAGKAYLVSTRDAARNVRAESYAQVLTVLGAAYPIERIDADALTGKADVMFLFTGIAQVADIASNSFLDGAIADHLTSFGGVLTGAGQTTALEWLTDGATGSYGTSTEPCSFHAKFPNVGVVMAHYLGGETLVEAYWKSVLMPGQGVFVGEPLARPFGGVRISRSKVSTVVQTRALPPDDYVLEASTGSVGPFRAVASFRATGFGMRRLTLPAGDTRFFRVRSVQRPAKSAG